MAILYNIAEAVQQSEFNVLQESFKVNANNIDELWKSKSYIDRLFKIETMTTFMEEERSSNQMNGFDATEDGETFLLDDDVEGNRKRFYTQIWTSGYKITRQTIEDQQFDGARRKHEKFLDSYYRTKEYYAAAVYSGAYLGSFFFGMKSDKKKQFDMKGRDTVDGTIDGQKQIYFHRNHISSVIASRIQSNKFYSNIDWTAGLGTIVEQTRIVLNKLAEIMTNFTDDKGNKLNLQPRQIVVGDFNWARELFGMIFGTDKNEYFGTNAKLIRPSGLNIESIVFSPYLGGLPGFEPNKPAFILQDTEANGDYRGFVWKNRLDLEIKSYLIDDNDVNVTKGRSRFGAAVNDFRSNIYCVLTDVATPPANWVMPGDINDATTYVELTPKVDFQLLSTSIPINPVKVEAKIVETEVIKTKAATKVETV